MYTTGDGRHIFLSNFYLKQGIGLVYVIADFICMCLLELHGARSENNKVKNSST